MPSRRHACAARCGLTVPIHLLACSPCWHDLPAEIQRAVNVAYVRRKTDPVRHRAAVLEAIAWYREHRPTTARSA